MSMLVIEHKALKAYLVSNTYTPVYIATVAGSIQTKLIYDGQDVNGYSYVQLDEEGEPYHVTIPFSNFDRFVGKLGSKHVVYTVAGIKSLLDDLDKSVQNSK